MKFTATENPTERGIPMTTEATTPKQTWKRVKTGLYTANGTIYIAKTRYGWAYGTIVDGEQVEHDETTRPMNRARVLAERLVV